MTVLSACLILTSLVTFVVGQLLLKQGMELSGTGSLLRPRFLAYFGGGIASMTVSFFITLGLLQRFDLSYLYPFQGMSVILIALAGAVMLREKLTLQLLVGSLLITAGIVLVSLS